MKVKIAELKNRLSYYLRQVTESGEAIEVCARDETVALLSPVVPGASPSSDRAVQREEEALRRRLAAVGLVLEGPAGSAKLLAIEAQLAGDGRRDVPTVTAIRGERDW